MFRSSPWRSPSSNRRSSRKARGAGGTAKGGLEHEAVEGLSDARLERGRELTVHLREERFVLAEQPPHRREPVCHA